VDNFYKALGLLLDMASSIYLTEDNIKKEKGIIAQEIGMYLDDPSWALYFNTLKAAYTENRVRNNVAGTLESLEQITRQELELSYNSFYTFDNACVIAVGDVEEEEIYTLIEDKLRLGEKCADKTISDDMPFKRRVCFNMPVDKPIFTVGYRENIGGRDILSRICLNNIIMSMLCSRGSRLTARLIDNGLIDEELTGQYLCSDSFGMRMFSGAGDKADAVAEYIDREINRHLHYGIRQSELKRLVSMLRSRLEAIQDNISELTRLAADCFSKGIDILDIFEKYGTIDEGELLDMLSDYDCRVISIVDKE
jgi:predicted Zn-dependent peptidase